MNQGIKTIIYSAADITRAKALSTRNFWPSNVENPYYVGFKIGDQDIGFL
jgi:hypothetical protein